jgi:hypothetical protein
MGLRQLNWEEAIGQKVRIYRNLNNGTMSIQQKIEKSWKVTGHITEAVLKDVRFVVSEASRQRVIRERCKNVHAYGEGILVGMRDETIYAPYRLAYNPYTDCKFLDRESRQTIERCAFLVVRNNLVFVSADALPANDRSPAARRSPKLPQFNLIQFQQFAIAAA